MARILSILTVIFWEIAAGNFLSAQYPADEPIQPYSRSTLRVESRLVLDFDQPEDFADWLPMRNVRVSPGEGTLKIEATGEDPYFATPDLRKFPEIAQRPLSGIVFLRLRLKNDNGVVQIFWAETKKTNYNEANSVKLDSTDSDDWREIETRFTPSSDLFRLRIDPGVKQGTMEIDRLEILQADLSPMEISSFRTLENRVDLTLTNRGTSNAVWNLSVDGKLFATLSMAAGETKPVSIPFSGQKPFEAIALTVSDASKPEKTAENQAENADASPTPTPSLSRTFYNIQPDRPFADGESVTLRAVGWRAEFAKDGSGAKIFAGDSERPVALISPLAAWDEGLIPTTNSAEANEKNSALDTVSTRSFDVVLRESDAERVAFSLVSRENCASSIPSDEAKTAAFGDLAFRRTPDGLAFDLKSPEKIHGPVIRSLDSMKRALLCGVEFLEAGEQSSSTADIETADHLRFAPPILHVTIPLAVLATDRATLALAWVNPKETQPIFAVPDFLDGRPEGRMNLFGETLSGTLNISVKGSLEEAILWGVKRLGPPEPAPRLRSQEEEDALILAAFERSELRNPEDGSWRHAILPGGQKVPFGSIYGSDFLSTIWELTGQLPDVPRIDHGGGHISNLSSYLIRGDGELLAKRLADQAAERRRGQSPDGSFRYSGIYLRGHWDSTASGHVGNAVFALMSHWRLTGNAESLAAGLRGLEFANRFQTPRGAQVWELSLHTPDIMAASRCSMANLFAYEATGDEAYLGQARRWAILGLPFVYLWESAPLGGKDHPVMSYATIAVFGATNWVSPNWMGLPVQWCGLDYCHALILLAHKDKTLDWKEIAEGILRSAEAQQYPDGPSVGLLPDSFVLKSQGRNPFDINPSAIHYLRRLIDGKPTSLQIARGEGRTVASPYPVALDGATAVVTAPKGAFYQILLNGTTVKTVDSSAGTDRIPLE